MEKKLLKQKIKINLVTEKIALWTTQKIEVIKKILEFSFQNRVEIENCEPKLLEDGKKFKYQEKKLPILCLDMSDCRGISDNYDNWKNLIERSYPEGIK
jgi:hypothetical protein